MHRHQGFEHLVQHHAHVAVGQRTVPREQLLHVAAAHQVHGEEVAGATGGLHDVAVPHPQSSLAREPLEGGGVVGASQLGRDPAASWRSQARQTVPMPPAPTWSASR